MAVLAVVLVAWAPLVKLALVVELVRLAAPGILVELGGLAGRVVVGVFASAPGQARPSTSRQQTVGAMRRISRE